jgi:type IV pilus assembly protein PilC
MSGPITATGLFPGGVCQMVRVGEDTGTLDSQLETAADFYGKEVGYKLERMIALFEPLVIVVVGVIVGFVAIALVSALYGIFNQVKLS